MVERCAPTRSATSFSRRRRGGSWERDCGMGEHRHGRPFGRRCAGSPGGEPDTASRKGPCAPYRAGSRPFCARRPPPDGSPGRSYPLRDDGAHISTNGGGVYYKLRQPWLNTVIEHRRQPYKAARDSRAGSIYYVNTSNIRNGMRSAGPSLGRKGCPALGGVGCGGFSSGGGGTLERTGALLAACVGQN